MDTTSAPTLAARVRELRLAAGLSQEKLAQRADMSRESVRRVEAGAPVSLRTIDKLAAALGVQSAELLLSRAS